MENVKVLITCPPQLSARHDVPINHSEVSVRVCVGLYEFQARESVDPVYSLAVRTTLERGGGYGRVNG